MSGGEVFEFGACQLDSARRELRVAGRLQPVPPKVFALLHCLLAERERVVAKSELIDRVWGGADISEAALARTVMKARQALGDTESEAGFIRTVHRVGYRFAGEVRLLPRGAATPEAATQLRVALLPVENATGDAALDWAVQGLPALVAQGLEADRRLALVGAGAVAAAAAALPPQLTAVQRATALAGLLGTHCLVLAVLRTQAGRLRLEYRSFGRYDLRGRLQGPGVPALALRLAQALEAGFFPAGQWPVEFVSAQPLANEAFARAVELGQREDWQAAARLLRTVLEMEPASLTARLQYLRVLANLHDGQAIDLGRELLAAARQAGDERLLAMAHEAPGRVFFNLGGAEHTAEAEHHLDEALRLAAAHEDEDWVQRVHIGQALKAHVGRDYRRALDFYERALRGCERSGNLLRRAAVLNNRARAEACTGNLLVARELAEESLAVCRQHQLHANALDALSNLALIDAGLGLFRRAWRHCEQAAAGLSALPPNEQASGAWWVYVAGDLQAECRATGLLAQGGVVPDADKVPRDDGIAWAGAAWRHWHAGQADAAFASLRTAIQAARDSGYLEAAHDFASTLLWLLLRGSHLGEAEGLLAQTGQWPSAADDEAMRAAACHVRAARCHRAGRTSDAQAALDQARHHAPAGRWRVRATLDLAALRLEAGDLPTTLQLMRDVGPWLEEHPCGVLLRVRVLHARGQAARAAALLQSVADDWVEPGAAPAPELLSTLREALATAPGGPGPEWPRLLTLI